MNTSDTGSAAALVARPAATTGMLRANAMLAISSGAVGVTSYTCTLLMARLLTVGAYTDFSAAQALLTTVGVAASALVPLPLARIVRTYPRGSAQRRAGMAFAALVSLLIGVTAAVLLFGIANLFATPQVAVVVGASGLALFAIMPIWGWLQGESHFRRYALTSVAEVSLRLAFSVVAVLIGWSVGGALAGYIVGAGVVVVLGLGWVRHDLSWQPQVLRDRGRWLETGGIAAVQVVLSTLVGADVVLVALVATNSPAVAGYQAVATLAKGPVYVATGTILVSFPLLRTTTADRVPGIIRSAIRSFAWLAVPAAAVLATLPSALALRVLPARYGPSLGLLPWLALAGLGYGVVSVLVVLLLALRAHRRTVIALASSTACIVCGLVLGWSMGATHGLAVGAAAGSMGASLVALGVGAPYLPSGIARSTVRVVVPAGVLVVVLLLTKPYPMVWLTAVVVAGLVVVRQSRRQGSAVRKSSGQVAALPAGRLRITHLGFEDPAMPGAGGGSLRTQEIDQRLAAQGHSVTVLTTRFPGCVDRVQEGVHYVHIGLGKGSVRFTRLLGYLLVLPVVVRRYTPDLVVEDFFAPISTLAAPLWTRRPTVGMVQWLNARDKSRQYHLPLQLIERFGVRRYRHLIAVSEGVAAQLAVLNPCASITVIGNGVDPAAFTMTVERGQDVLFIGRLEIAQKGLDLLLDAWSRASSRISGQLVIAGEGADEARLRAMAAELGIADRVDFVGWISGEDKYRLLASARLVVVPSRFETFGIVALEALATGTPVVAFDIPCLREVIPVTCGRLVTPFDVAAYAQTLADFHQDTDWCDSAGLHGRQFAAAYDWDRLAERQAVVYCQVAGKTSDTAHSSAGHPDVGTIREQLQGLGGHRAQEQRRTGGRRRPRLTVLGNVGNGNTGDEALLTVTLAALDPDAEVTVLARRPAMIADLHGLTARPMTIPAALAALRSCDGLVIVGGGMFGPGLPPLVRLLPYVAAAVALTKRSVAYVGIGVYPGTSRGTLRALRRAARRRQITVRDQLSLRTLDLPYPVACVGDLAWQLVPADPVQARAELRQAGVDLSRPLLLVSPKAGTTDAQTAEQIDVMAEAIRHWLALGGGVAAIALSDRADRGRSPQSTDTALAQAIASRAETTLPIVGPNLPPPLAKAVTAQATAVLGLRFHSLVFAKSTARPCMGFAWEPKTCALLAEHHLATYSDVPALGAWLSNSIPAPDTARR